MTAPKRDRVVIPVTIATGTSLSAAVNVNGLEIVGVEMPAAWTAAGLAFQALTADGATFGKVQDEAGTEIVVAAPGAGLYSYLKTGLKGLGRIKVVSGTNAVPVAQAADRVLALVCLT